MPLERLEQQVTAQEAGWPLGRFLLERMALSKRQITRLKQFNDGLWVNGERATVRHPLKADDTVSDVWKTEQPAQLCLGLSRLILLMKMKRCWWCINLRDSQFIRDLPVIQII